MIGTYLSLPVTVHACQIEDHNGSELEAFALGHIRVMYWEHEDRVRYVQVKTEDGFTTGMPGDVLIRGTRGEFFVLTAKNFKFQYVRHA